jgi:AbrB family looped-hinge helix DNA binding protein
MKRKAKSSSRRSTDDRSVSVEPVKRPFAARVPVDDAGRVVVPAQIRRALGIQGGQQLSISLEGDVIRLQTVDTVLERARAIARRKRKRTGSVVDEFITDRRAEAAKE